MDFLNSLSPPTRALAVLLALWMVREATWPLREKSLRGQVALVTGGGSGIGRLMALRFGLKEGCTVVIWDLNEKGAQDVANEIIAKGGKALAYKCDVSDRHAVYAVAAETLRAVGGTVDIVVNNAGIVSGKKLLEADDARSDLTMKVNSTALLWVTKAFLPGMMAKKRGHVVTIASSAGRVGVRGMTDYCASKFAAVGFSEALRMEMRHACPGVKSTCVCPSYINTGMFHGAMMRSTVPFLNPIVRAVLPVLEPEYVADRIVQAVKRDQEVLVMPRFGYLSHLFRAILPVAVFDMAMDVLGVSNSMDEFVQTRA